MADFDIKFFNLDEEPFSVSPDPSYFYLSPLHRGILQKVKYVVRRRQCLSVLYGQVGTGKTSMAQILIARLSETNQVHYIPSPLYSSEMHMMKEISADFGLPPKISLHAQMNQFKDHLIQLYSEEISPVLIIDEAQQLKGKAYDLIRMMTNFELPDVKLIQILLIGQAELRNKLKLKRALTSRIAVTSTLESFTPDDMVEMIKFRIQRAGGDDSLIEEDAYPSIWELSHGIPRDAMHILGLALELAYLNRVSKLSKEIIDFAYAEGRK